MKEKNSYKNSKMKKKIHFDKFIRTFKKANVLVLICLSTALLVIILINSFISDKLLAYNLIRYVFFIGLWLALSTFTISYLFNKINLLQTVQEIDAEKKGKNRLETIVEFEKKNHVLKKLQYSEAENFYKNYSIKKEQFLFFTVLSLITLVTFSSFFYFNGAKLKFFANIDQKNKFALEKFLKKKEKLKEQKKKPQVQTAKNKKKKEKIAIKEIAVLKLVNPESEVKLRPLDEVEWQAVAKTAHGFSNLQLVVLKNGQKIKNYKVKNNKKGHIKFSDVFALDEFDAMPYDLISYYLEGQTSLNDKKATILSMPQYIEILPFKEDITQSNCDESANHLYEFLVSFLNSQVLLHKATFSIKIAKSINPEVKLKNKYETIYLEQFELSRQLRKFLDDGFIMMDDKKISLGDYPSDTINCLEKASSSIQKSLKELKGLIVMTKMEDKK
ncbi:hypothetical protein AAEX28_01805 [Lentisphaerota bacterium WC36G]|nr:hypothetical protein LJT99_04690 [Lentisphaerae bacterium WC36]